VSGKTEDDAREKGKIVRLVHDKNKQKDDKTPRMTKFTTLVMTVDKILVQIKNDHHLKWLRLLHSSPDV